MSDKKPVKRGVLSGLMGLFGDEEAAGQAPEGGGAPSPAVARADEPPHLSDRSSQGEGYQEDPYAANPRGPERRQTDVVREAYEPGWYRISAAMAVSEDEEDEQEEPSGPDAEADAQTEQPDVAASLEQPEVETDQQPEVATEQQPEVDISTEQQQAVAENDQQQPEVATEEHPVEVVPEQPPEVLEEPAAARTIEEPQAADVGATPQFEAPSPEPAADPSPIAEGAEGEASGAGHDAVSYQAPSTYAGPVPETTDAGQDQVASEQISQPQEQALPAEAAEPGPPHEAEAVSPSPEDADGAATAPDEAGVAATAPDEADVAAAGPDDAEAGGPGLDDVAAPGDPRLRSRDPAERREAVMAVASAGVSDQDVPVLAALLQDPDRGIRVAAVEALTQRADVVDREVVLQVLRDPVDQVRAAAVRLAASRSSADVHEIFAVVAERHWPLSQQAALEVLPGVAQRSGMADETVRILLSAVGQMDSQPVPAEQDGLVTLARLIGTDRLARWLDAGDSADVGAARLLNEEGSEAALTLLTGRSTEGSPQVQALAQQASDRLAQRARLSAAAEAAEASVARQVSEEAEQGPPPEASIQHEMVGGLARALEDPGEGVRERAREALASLQHDQVAGWVGESLGSEDDDRAALGAEVAAAAGLSEVAPQVLNRAMTSSPEARASFVRSLSSLGLGGDSVSGLVESVPPDRRPEAVRLLWESLGAPVLEHMSPLLQDTSAQVRLAALEVIAEASDPSSVEVARAVLERDTSPLLRAAAIKVIGRAGLDQQEASLQKALSDPDPDVRATAVELLLTGLGGQAAHVLLRALSDDDERVWRAAVRSLTDVPDHERGVVWTALVQCPPDRRDELLAALEQTGPERLAALALEHLMSPDPQDRTMAIRLAGRSATPDAVRGIASALQDPAASVRRSAAQALAALRTPSAIPALAGSLYDPDIEVRVEAVRGLSEIDDDQVLDALIGALKDPEVRVREVAGDALVRWRSPAVARRLALALGDPSLRRPAGEVLARMGTAAVDPLVDMLSDEGPDVVRMVGQLLRELTGPELFVDRLGSMDPEDRRRAVEALGAMGGEEGLDGLARALSDPIEGIRVRAVTLLGESRDPRAFEAVKRTFLSDPVLEVVTAAEEALQKLQPGVEPGPN